MHLKMGVNPRCSIHNTTDGIDLEKKKHFQRSFDTVNTLSVANHVFFPVWHHGSWFRMQNKMAIQTQAFQADLYVTTLKAQGAKCRIIFFLFLFLCCFHSLIEADLYQAAVALTPVTVTGYTLLHHSGLLTAEWQLDNPLWNDLGLVSDGL